MYLFVGFASSDAIDGTPSYSEGLFSRSFGVWGLTSLRSELVYLRGRLFRRLEISANDVLKTSLGGYLYLFFSASRALYKVDFVCLTRLSWAPEVRGAWWLEFPRYSLLCNPFL